MKTKRCPTHQELAEFDLGKLALARHDEITDHLDDCAACTAVLESLEEHADDLIAKLREKLPPEILQEDSELYRLVEAANALRDTSIDTLAAAQTHAAVPSKPPVQQIIAQLLGPAQSTDEIGRLGGYRVLEVLGIGGMGVVFKAEDPMLARMVALKAMLPHVAASSKTARDRFLREARATASIQHDHIVTIHQVGEDDGVPFLAMQLLQGESLAARLRREQQLPIDEVCRIARELAAGLAVAHTKGLTHRDIKPDNLWLENVGRATSARVKILDFGLARVADDTSHLTQTDAIVGTPGYLAPEQAKGKPADARTDLYALGVVMYCMLTGTRPFQRSSLLATLRAIETETPPSPASVRSDVPPALSQLVMRLLEKEPLKRYQSAGVLIEAIRDIEEQPKCSVELQRTRETRPNARVLVATAAAVLLVLLAAVIIFITTDRGTIVVKATDGFQVTSENQHLTIRDTESRRTYEVRIDEAKSLPSGEYEISVRDNEGLEFQAKQFRVKRGERELVVNLLPISPDAARVDATLPHVADHLPPISSLAVVQRPAKLVSKDGESVLSWTIATRNVIAPDAIIPALRADGKFVAAFSNDGCVRVWDVERKQLMQVLVGHAAGPAFPTGTRTGLAVRNNSRRFGQIAWQGTSSLLATASRDGSLRVWNVESGAVVFQQDGPADDINIIAWSPNGAHLVAAYTRDGSIRGWNANDWKEIKPLDPLRRSPRCLVWSPDSTTLAVATDQGTLLWTPADGKQRAMPETPVTNGNYGVTFGAAAVRWAPNGDRLAYRHGNAVTICDTKSLQPGPRLQLADKPTAALYDFAWSPDGRQMLVGWMRDDKQERHIHDSVTGEVIHSFDDETYDHVACVEWLPDGKRLMIGNRLVDLETKRILKGSFSMLWEASTDGKVILATEVHGVPWVFRLDEDSGEAESVFFDGRVSPVLSTALPDGHSLSLETLNTMVSILDWTGLPSADGYRQQSMLVTSWSPDGKHMLVGNPGGGSGEIRSWPDGKEVHRLEGIGVTAHAWSPDGSKLAVAGSDRILRLIDVATGLTSGPWSDPAGIGNYINSIAWSEDGSMIAAGGNLIVAILSATDGSLRVSMDPQMGAGRLCWTPDQGNVLCFGNHEVLIYDPQTGKIVRRIAASVTPLSYSGWPGALPIHFTDKQTFQFVSAAGELAEIDIATGARKILRSIPCNAAQFSPAGDYVFGDQGLVRRLWRTVDGHPIVSFVTSEILASPEGHVWTRYNASGPLWPTSPGFEETLAYIVKTASGQETLSPLEFANRYGWHNDPLKVRLK